MKISKVHKRIPCYMEYKRCFQLLTRKEKLRLCSTGKGLHQKKALKTANWRTSSVDLALSLKILSFIWSHIFHKITASMLVHIISLVFLNGWSEISRLNQLFESFGVTMVQLNDSKTSAYKVGTKGQLINKWLWVSYFGINSTDGDKQSQGQRFWSLSVVLRHEWTWMCWVCNGLFTLEDYSKKKKLWHFRSFFKYYPENQWGLSQILEAGVRSHLEFFS